MAGIAEEAECVAIAATDIAGLVGFCRRERIGRRRGRGR
jgi:hypothetical protein